MSELEKFLEERSKIPIPGGDVTRIKLLAKELALGVHRELWTQDIAYGMSLTLDGDNLQEFFCKRWGNKNLGHTIKLLESYGFVTKGHGDYSLSREAFDLLEETDPYNVFISYKRSESSALALLCVCRLKAEDHVPFVDMALEAGGNWHADLEERTKGCDYFIILLGKDTFSSEMTVKEIGWAVDAERTIIPIWHSGFDIGSDKWSAIPAEVKDAIQQTNAIRVTDESASGYNTAIVELLNRFGITP